MLICTLSLQAQQADLYPDLVSSYIYNPALINAGYVSKTGIAEFIGNYKQRTGPFRGISSYAFTASGYLRSSNEMVHAGRVVVFNETEGPYISRPRGYLNYANRMPLADDIFLSAGLAMGFAGISYSASTATGVGSSFVPDGNAGLMLKSRNFMAGVSAMQIFSSDASPLTGVLTYKRYFNLFASAEHEFALDWRIEGFLLYNQYRGIDPDLDLGFLIKYIDLLTFGSSVRYRRGSSFFLSALIPQQENQILLSFIYNSPLLTARPLWQNSLEISLGFIIQ